QGTIISYGAGRLSGNDARTFYGQAFHSVGAQVFARDFGLRGGASNKGAVLCRRNDPLTSNFGERKKVGSGARGRIPQLDAGETRLATIGGDPVAHFIVGAAYRVARDHVVGFVRDLRAVLQLRGGFEFHSGGKWLAVDGGNVFACHPLGDRAVGAGRG